MNKLSLEERVGVNSHPPPLLLPVRGEWEKGGWESTPTLPLSFSRWGGSGRREGGSQLPPSPSPSLGEGGVGEGRVGVNSHPPPLLFPASGSGSELLYSQVIKSLFCLLKRRETRKKNTQSQRLAAMTILVLQLVMLNSLITFLSIILFRTF